MQSTSVRRAIAIGTAWVNLPVLPLMLAPLTIYVSRVPRTVDADALPGALAGMLGSFLTGFVVAWLWWALMVPRWRLWAWRRVQEKSELKTRAIAVGLLWPDGHFFGRTEIRSAKMNAELAALENAGHDA
jgi:hypothetical protein